jgi:hypothetical protein
VTGTRTISFKVTPDVTTFNGQARQFMFSQYSSSGKRTVYIEFRDTGVIRAFLPTTSTGNSYVLLESNAGVYFNAGQEYYITATIDASTGAKIMVDGVAQTNTSPTTTLGFTRSGAPCNWGGWYLFSTGSSNATMRDLAIWNVSRTPAEIVTDMTRVWTGSESGLKGYFPTTEGSGTTIQDINTTYTGTLSTTNPSPTYEDDFMWVTI